MKVLIKRGLTLLAACIGLATLETPAWTQVVPQKETRDAATAPKYSKQPNSKPNCKKCPVLKLEGWTYWVFTHEIAMNSRIIAFDSSNKVMSVWGPIDTTNVTDIEVDTKAKTFTVIGTKKSPPQPWVSYAPSKVCGPRFGPALCGTKVRLKSWRGDYLHRPGPESPEKVTAWSVAQDWTVECKGSKVMLKSWRGDYLHRDVNRAGPESTGKVTTWDGGPGSEWSFECKGDNVLLKSSSGDFLHRPGPESPEKITAWEAGSGNEWTMESVPAKP